MTNGKLDIFHSRAQSERKFCKSGQLRWNVLLLAEEEPYLTPHSGVRNVRAGACPETGFRPQWSAGFRRPFFAISGRLHETRQRTFDHYESIRERGRGGGGGEGLSVRTFNLPRWIAGPGFPTTENCELEDVPRRGTGCHGRTGRQDNETLTVQLGPRRASKLRSAKRSTDMNYFDPLSELPSQVNVPTMIRSLCSSIHSDLPDVRAARRLFFQTYNISQESRNCTRDVNKSLFPKI